MWKNSLKNVESDKNIFFYEILLDFLQRNDTYFLNKSRTNLTTVQQDATYSVYYISVGSSTCFGCWHPSSGARTAVITTSDID